jgi:hypothetical protein
MEWILLFLLILTGCQQPPQENVMVYKFKWLEGDTWKSAELHSNHAIELTINGTTYTIPEQESDWVIDGATWEDGEKLR